MIIGRSYAERIREFVRQCEKNPDLLNTHKTLPADYAAMGTAAQLFMKSLLMGADHALDRSEYSSFEIEALPFEAAVKYMTKKMPMKAEEYYRLSDKERFRAFTVGRIADGAILERVKKALADNMKEKTGFSTFLKQTDREILDAVGMGTGKAWYWETVYRTNIQTSYNVGRALGFEATQPLALEFVGLEDDRQTDICRKLSEARIIRPYGDPFWDTHTPPLHFNCRSTLRAIYDREELPEEYAPIKNEKAYTPAKGFGSAPTKGDGWWEELSGMKAQAERYGVQKEIEAAREKLVSGGGILEKSNEEQKAYATRAYAAIRKKNAEKDIEKVSKSSGLTKEEVAKVRNHLFFEKHDLDDGIRLFDAVPQIAHAWEALEQGRASELDIMLVKHELEELTLMKKYGYTYEKAHLLADTKYPWDMKLKGWKDDQIRSYLKEELWKNFRINL